jgi:hypothetical protein
VLLRELRATVGMTVYPWLGRLLLEPFAPIHATRRRMRRWLGQAGLRVDERESRTVWHEVCYVAEKPAVQSAEAAPVGRQSRAGGRVPSLFAPECGEDLMALCSSLALASADGG